MVGSEKHSSALAADKSSFPRGSNTVPTFFLKSFFVLPLIAAMTFGNQTQMPRAVQSSTKPKTALDILRDAASDTVISNDEIYSYSRALPKWEKSYRKIPHGLTTEDILTLSLSAEEGMAFDTMRSRLVRSNKKALHFIFAETQSYTQTDIYITDAELQNMQDVCATVQSKVGPKHLRFALFNTDSSSTYSSVDNEVALSGKEVLISYECFGFVTRHEGGHALYKLQQQAGFLQNNTMQSHEVLRSLFYDQKPHKEEDFCDNFSALWIDSAKGAMDFFIWDRPKNKDKFKQVLKEANIPLPDDEHSDDLKRTENVLLAIGLQLQ